MDIMHTVYISSLSQYFFLLLLFCNSVGFSSQKE